MPSPAYQSQAKTTNFSSFKITNSYSRIFPIRSLLARSPLSRRAPPVQRTSTQAHFDFASSAPACFGTRIFVLWLTLDRKDGSISSDWWLTLTGIVAQSYRTSGSIYRKGPGIRPALPLGLGGSQERNYQTFPAAGPAPSGH